MGPSVITDVPLWWGMSIMGEAVHVLEERVYRKSLYLLLNFAVSLKLF